MSDEGIGGDEEEEDVEEVAIAPPPLLNNSVLTKGGKTVGVVIIFEDVVEGDVVEDVVEDIVVGEAFRPPASAIGGGRFGATPEMKPPDAIGSPDAGKTPPPEVRAEIDAGSGRAEEEEEGAEAETASATEDHCRPKYIVFLYIPLRSTWTVGNPRRITLLQ